MMAEHVPGSKGLLLEEVLKWHFCESGYYAVRAVPFRVDGEDVTDIDLWLYERPGAMGGRRWIVDIKYKKTPKAAERIIWVRGLRQALDVDGCIVATPDKRLSIARLARSVGVELLDGDTLAKIRAENEGRVSVVPLDAVDAAIKSIDHGRRTSEWKDMITAVRSAVIRDFGIQSANAALLGASYFSDQTVVAHPGSEQAQWGTRLFYFCVGLASASLHFALTRQAFASRDEKKSALIQGLRFGQSVANDTIATVRMAIGLARKYADNGAVVAKQIEKGFLRDAENIQAEIVAEHVTRMTDDSLFNAALQFDAAAFAAEVPAYDQLTTEMRATAGAVLDFANVPRERMAKAWPLATRSASSGGGNRSLFDEHR
jgi:hypothetical protein